LKETHLPRKHITQDAQAT